jgi:flagellar hook protein FlgE
VANFNQNDGNSFNYSASIKVFDEAGQSVEISTFYKKIDPNRWEVYVTANGRNVPPKADPADPAVPIDTIEFTKPSGEGPPLRDGGAVGDADQAVLTINAQDLMDALNTQAVTDSGLSYTFADLKLNLKGAGQQAGDYTISKLEQNGFGVGSLSGFSFDERGILTAKYTNGQDRSTGQLAIASFRNPQGLQSVGGNAWQETAAVGSKVMDVPGTGNLGDIVAGAVEESNVDLTAELVNLITAQRTYQANAQSIKTQDQVTQTFLNMR